MAQRSSCALITWGTFVDDAVNLRQWTNLVRRARLGSHTTAVALTLATYADADGSRVYPGIARLSYDIELSYTTVKRALAKLREAGLIRKVGRHGDADTYRLIFAEDLMERVEVPTPAQVEAHLETVRKHKRGTYVPRLRPSSGAADAEDEPNLRLSSGAADEFPAALQESPTDESAALSDTICGSPRRAATVQDRVTTTTIHADEDLLADVTIPRASDEPRSPRCPHGNNPRTRPGTQIPRCELCRSEKTAGSASNAATAPLPEPIAVPVVSGPGRYTKARCTEHGLPQATCTLCRRGLSGKAAA